MKTFDVTEAQVRLNECGEGEYVRREVAERLRVALEFVWTCVYEHDPENMQMVNEALDYAEEN